MKRGLLLETDIHSTKQSDKSDGMQMYVTHLPIMYIVGRYKATSLWPYLTDAIFEMPAAIIAICCMQLALRMPTDRDREAANAAMSHLGTGIASGDQVTVSCEYTNGEDFVELVNQMILRRVTVESCTTFQFECHHSTEHLTSSLISNRSFPIS